jgi:hypothetical protein
LCRHTSGIDVFKVIPVNRRKMVSNAICPSMRAKAAPKQK